MNRRSFLGLLAAVPAAAVAATLPTNPTARVDREFESDWFIAGRRAGKSMLSTRIRISAETIERSRTGGAWQAALEAERERFEREASRLRLERMFVDGLR